MGWGGFQPSSLTRRDILGVWPAPHLTGNESELLGRINRGLATGDRARLKELIDKRDAETITSTDLQELIGMTDRLEKLQAERLAALAELATLRGVTFDEVILSR